jgi:hypothetical protein
MLVTSSTTLPITPVPSREALPAPWVRLRASRALSATWLTLIAISSIAEEMEDAASLCWRVLSEIS